MDNIESRLLMNVKLMYGTGESSAKSTDFSKPLLAWPLEKQREQYFQREKTAIINQLKFAKRNVPFFKEKLDNVTLANIRTYEDFYKFTPITEPDEIVKNPELFCSKFPIAFVRKSSSTTDKPKKIFLTKHDLRHWANVGRLARTPYYKEGMVVAHSRRKERFYLSNLDGSVKASGGKVITFSPRKKSELLKCAQKADVILDYAEMIYYISKQISSIAGVNLNKRLLVSYTGNKLDKEDIKEIKKNFISIGVNTDIYSEYATSETGPIGYAAEDEPFKIIYSDNIFVEVIDPRNGLPAREGEIIITALNRTGSVFIRYRLRDIGAIFFKGTTPCFNLKRRGSGIRVASVFFSPQYVFSTIRNILRQPIFCNIKLKKGKVSYIEITVVSEKRVHRRIQRKIERELINEMHFEGDVGSTVNIRITYNHRKFSEREIRKGFSFSQQILEK